MGSSFKIEPQIEYVEETPKDEDSELFANEDFLDYDNGKISDPLLLINNLNGIYSDDDDILESWIDYSEEDKKKINKLDAKKRGLINYPKSKKNQVLCRVQKTIHHHREIGHEFFPKSYTSYTCHPVNPQNPTEGLSLTSQDSCYVNGNNCITVEKEQLFLKKLHNTNCWNHFVEAVGAGCKCFARKYSN